MGAALKISMIFSFGSVVSRRAKSCSNKTANAGLEKTDLLKT